MAFYWFISVGNGVLIEPLPTATHVQVYNGVLFYGTYPHVAGHATIVGLLDTEEAIDTVLPNDALVEAPISTSAIVDGTITTSATLDAPIATGAVVVAESDVELVT